LCHGSLPKRILNSSLLGVEVEACLLTVDTSTELNVPVTVFCIGSLDIGLHNLFIHFF
jgi:hypothetical protein